MRHLDEGTVLALRDGALVTTEAGEHVHACPKCTSAVEEAERRADLIAASLPALDEPFDVEAAKQRVRARLDAAPERRVRPRRGVHLGRAAAILLVTAGAVAALPGSPLREWLRATTGAGNPDTTPAAAPQEAGHEGGIVVNVPDGRIHVVLTGLGPGSTLDVVWRDAATARITAAAGSSFSFAEGRAEARVAPGPVRVELPRYAPTVSVEVDGRMYVRRTTAAGLEVLEPAAESSGERIRFVVPEHP